jgi:hypothetical protein
MKPEYGWHFLADRNGAPVYRDGTPAHVGETLRHDGPLVLCESGLHYSLSPLDALAYTPGPYVCRIRIKGERIHVGDKGVCRKRTIIWMADATPLLHALARHWAAEVAYLWPAPEVVLRYLATGDESIRAAARDAAWAAAGDAAWAAARDAAWDAAWDATRDRQNDQFEAALMQIEKALEVKP